MRNNYYAQFFLKKFDNPHLVLVDKNGKIYYPYNLLSAAEIFFKLRSEKMLSYYFKIK